jgi:hypothetical protein
MNQLVELLNEIEYQLERIKCYGEKPTVETLERVKKELDDVDVDALYSGSDLDDAESEGYKNGVESVSEEFDKKLDKLEQFIIDHIQRAKDAGNAKRYSPQLIKDAFKAFTEEN